MKSFIALFVLVAVAVAVNAQLEGITGAVSGITGGAGGSNPLLDLVKSLLNVVLQLVESLLGGGSGSTTPSSSTPAS